MATAILFALSSLSLFVINLEVCLGYLSWPSCNQLQTILTRIVFTSENSNILVIMWIYTFLIMHRVCIVNLQHRPITHQCPGFKEKLLIVSVVYETGVLYGYSNMTRGSESMTWQLQNQEHDVRLKSLLVNWVWSGECSGM